MKKFYTIPEMEVIICEREDVLVTSGLIVEDEGEGSKNSFGNLFG